MKYRMLSVHAVANIEAFENSPLSLSVQKKEKVQNVRNKNI